MDKNEFHRWIKSKNEVSFTLSEGDLICMVLDLKSSVWAVQLIRKGLKMGLLDAIEFYKELKASNSNPFE